MNAHRLIRIHVADNVAVAPADLSAGTQVRVADVDISLSNDVPAGHKAALLDLPAGATVIKYGFPIGVTTVGIRAGEWVHKHNLQSTLENGTNPPAKPARTTNHTAAPATMPTFDGYRRASGRVGTRNEIWIINTVGCVNHAAERIAKLAADRFAGRVDGVYAFSHPYGCSQLGDDLRNTQSVLAGLLRHPNAGGVLVLGLGCENNQMQQLLERAGDVDQSRLRFFNTQEVLDEIDVGLEAIEELVTMMQADARVACPASELWLGMKCGGSDGFSGITANPLVGRIADRITALDGGALLTEVPEMFGAESILLERAASPTVAASITQLIEGFKDYFRAHHQPIDENPSPGNRDGGITTLEEKSLGAVQKGGRAPITSVLRYGEPATIRGVALLEAPGNDGVSATAMVASGATMLLFTTGRGTPLGFPVPTVKISSNSDIAARKPHWIDFNAGILLDGSRTIDEVADELFELVLDIASGRRQANNEMHGYREIAIWKEGITL